MTLKNINNDDLRKIAGGAVPGKPNGKYLFYCSKCGYKWFGNDNPKEVHGCPECGEWYTNKRGEECIKYKKLR